MPRLALLLASLLPALLPAAAQSLFVSAGAEHAFADIYAFRDDAFEVDLRRVSDKAIRAYLREYHALMHYAAANNSDNYDTYMTLSDAALDAIDNHTYEPTLRCNLLLHRCLVELSDGSWVGGGLQFKRSYSEFKDAELQHPELTEQLMLRGIYNILLSQIPDKWRWFASLLGFDDGDLELGLRQIAQYRHAMQGVGGLQDESLLLSFANIFLSHEQRADAELEQCMRRSDAPIVRYAYLLSMGRQQRGSEADEVIARCTPGQFIVFPLLRHQQAKFAMRRMEPDRAIAYADTFALTYRGTACVNDIYLIKAYSYLLKGERERATALAEQCAAVTAKSDVDHRTHADALRVRDEDLHLLRSRMCFEYGRYADAKAEIVDYSPPPTHRIEHTFRLARAQEKLGNTDAALRLYDTTIAAAANDDRYFGPYAALYAADIMLERGNTDAARQYALQAQKLNNGEFSKEIAQRIALMLRAIKY